MLVLVLVGALAPPLTLAAGRAGVAWASRALVALASIALLAVALGAGETLAVPWIPSWGVRLAVGLDGLAVLYAGLAVGIGGLVALYAPPYLRRRGTGRRVAFFGLLAAFLSTMVGLAVAEDLLLLLVCFDLTAVVSYLLIGFERERPEARSAARVALLVTGVPSLAFVTAVVLLHVDQGTTAITALRPLPLAAWLIALAAIAKSAQVPFQGWLPAAMVAPTPVSAWLHSAAMVAAGVLVLQRLYPLVSAAGPLPGVLVVVGTASILVGGALALTRRGLKEILAWSTIAQYGHVTLLIGVGGEAALAASLLYVLVHALAKAGLFLVVGAVTTATGAHDLSEVGGLARRMPLLAAVAGVLGAGLAGLPLTLGFAKDEHLFAALAHASPAHAVVGVLAAALTLAYTWRLWHGIFLGAPEGDAAPLPAAILAPPVLLAALVLVGGVWSQPAVRLATDAAGSVLGWPVSLEEGSTVATWMAVAAWALGALLIASRGAWGGALGAATALFSRARPVARVDAALHALSDRLFTLEVRSLRDRLASVFAPAAVLVGLSLLAPPLRRSFVVGKVGLADLPLVLVLALVAVTALGTALQRTHTGLVLAFGTLGTSLVASFAMWGAPDVALTLAVVTTITTLLIFAGLSLLPHELLVREADRERREHWRWRDPVVALLAAVGALLFTWNTLSPLRAPGVAEAYLAHEAGPDNVVAAILTDYRGLDTVGETTVLLLALLGLAHLLGRTRPEVP